jgi:hypothetical protein
VIKSEEKVVRVEGSLLRWGTCDCWGNDNRKVQESGSWEVILCHWARWIWGWETLEGLGNGFLQNAE